MALYLNARFDLEASMQVDIDQWEIKGPITDNTGIFSIYDTAQGDIISLDATSLGMGILRYKILSVDMAASSFYYFVGTVQWDDSDATPTEPMPGLTGSLGRGDALGSGALPGMTMNSIDETYLANVRNVESMRLSKIVGITKNQVELIRNTKEAKLGNPTVDGSFLSSNTNGIRSWKKINPIEQIEKGAADGVATLDWTGKIPLSQIPAIAITDVFIASTEAEMLALTAEKGDVCKRTDVSKTYILTGGPASDLMNWMELTATGAGGGTGGGVASVSSETKRIQPFRPGSNYAAGEQVTYDNRIWAAARQLNLVSIFQKSDWIMISGDMSLDIYDLNGDGIIDQANHANTSNYAMHSDITRMLQTWKPYTQYVSGEMMIWENEIWTVIDNFTSTDKFDGTKLEPMSIKRHDVLLNMQGGDPLHEEFYHITNYQHQIVDRMDDVIGALYYNDKPLGDMLTSVYDPNKDGIVSKADTLAGMTVVVGDLNHLQGIKSNVQQQIEAIVHGMIFKGTVDTFATLTGVSDVFQGDTYIVAADETRDYARTFYTFSQGSWQYLGPFTVSVRDFSIQPLNLVTESVGYIPDSRIDNTIARKTDMHTHVNKSVIDSYTNSNVDITLAVQQKHAHSNKALLDSYSVANTDLIDATAKKHVHTNIATIDGFSETASGGLLWRGQPIEGNSGGGGGGGGIIDLTSFTTDDLAESATKKYMTIDEKNSLLLVPSMQSSITTLNTSVNTIKSVIPANATTSNKLITAADMTTIAGVNYFKDLKDVGSIAGNTDSFVMVNPTGTGLTYLKKSTFKMNIQKITDMDGNIYTDVPFIKFKSAKGLKLADGTIELTNRDIFSTEVVDMPKTFENGKLLVSNSDLMKYELKSIEEVTNSKANYSSNILVADWSLDPVTGKQAKIVQHDLQSRNLIVGFYDVNETNISLKYKILNDDQIMVYSDTAIDGKVVVNCSQGTVGNGTGGGGTINITSTMFLDDTRVRIDKTYSSDKITKVLSEYAKTANVYNRAESDANFATKNTEHTHANKSAIDKIKEDAMGNPMYGDKPLLTQISSRFYEQHWTAQNNTALNVVLDVNSVFSSQSFGSILDGEFMIKNTVPSVDKVTDELPENQLRVVMTDGTITILDVMLKPQEVQKYLLGISPNVIVMVQGKFDANYYVTAL